MQIGLVDMLRKEYGIVPAGMLGHSAGEIPCGYADGCLTREQTILIAYHRGALPVILQPCHSAFTRSILCRPSCTHAHVCRQSESSAGRPSPA